MCCVMPPASRSATRVVADGVEQAGLAVVDVAHDGDDRRARDDVFGVAISPSSTCSSSSSKLRICTSAPNSRAIMVAVSVSSAELIVSMSRFISSFARTSLTRRSSLSARSFTVMPSASVMVRDTGGGAAGIGGGDGRGSRRWLAAGRPEPPGRC